MLLQLKIEEIKSFIKHIESIFTDRVTNNTKKLVPVELDVDTDISFCGYPVFSSTDCTTHYSDLQRIPCIARNIIIDVNQKVDLPRR
jgi:hypothetical protein